MDNFYVIHNRRKSCFDLGLAYRLALTAYVGVQHGYLVRLCLLQVRLAVMVALTAAGDALGVGRSSTHKAAQHAPHSCWEGRVSSAGLLKRCKSGMAVQVRRMRCWPRPELSTLFASASLIEVRPMASKMLCSTWCPGPQRSSSQPDGACSSWTGSPMHSLPSSFCR